MFVANIGAFILLRNISAPNTRNDEEEAEAHPVIESQDQSEEDEGLSPESYAILKKTGNYYILFVSIFTKLPSDIFVRIIRSGFW